MGKIKGGVARSWRVGPGVSDGCRMAERNIGERKGAFGCWCGVICNRGAVASL